MFLQSKACSFCRNERQPRHAQLVEIQNKNLYVAGMCLQVWPK